MSNLLNIVEIENLVEAAGVNGADYLVISQAGITKKITFTNFNSGSALPALTNGQVWIGNGSNVATGVTPSGDATISNTGVITIANNAVTAAKFRQSAGLSVVGNATSSTANVSDITASTNFGVLQRSGTSLTFGLITNSNIDSGAGISYSKLNLTGQVVNGDINGAAAIAYSKLALSNSITNSDIFTSANIALSKLENTSFSKTIGTIATSQTINYNLARAVSSNGDSFGATMKIGTNDDQYIEIVQKGNVVFRAQENLGSYDPKFIMIGDQAVQSTSVNECVNIGSTSQQTDSGVGIGTRLTNRITVSQNNPTLVAISQEDSVYNPLAYTMTSSRLIGLKLGYNTTIGKDWELQFTRAANWETTEGDAGTVTAFADGSAPTVYVGGNGTNNINYIMGDPASYIRVSVYTASGTTVDRYIPAYSLTQLP